MHTAATPELSAGEATCINHRVSMGVASRFAVSPASATVDPGLLEAARQYVLALRGNVEPSPRLSAAWEAFYHACEPHVRRTISACPMPRGEFDDCSQEAWTEIVTKLTRFTYDPSRGDFYAWLYVVVRRAAVRYTVRRLKRSVPSEGRLQQAICGRIHCPVTVSQRREVCALVGEALQAFRTRVSSTAFRILMLASVEGRTSSEIGELLGYAPGRVRVVHHRTLQKLRRFLASQPGLRDGRQQPPRKQ